MQTMITSEALQYIAEQTGRERPPHKTQLNRWQRYGWIAPHILGISGKPNIYTVYDLDVLVVLINTNHRKKRTLINS